VNVSDKKIDEKVNEVLSQFGIANEELTSLLVKRFIEKDRQSRAFVCPSCNTVLALNLEVTVKKVKRLEDLQVEKNDAPPAHKPSRFTEQEDVFLVEMKANGMYQAFADCVDRLIVSGGKPADTESYFLAWIDKAVKVKVPNFSLRTLIDEFSGERLDVYASQYIAGIVANGKVVAFYPYALLKGEAVDKLTPSGSQITATGKPMTTEVWRRSKYGYVVGRGAFFTEMQAKSKGAFDTSAL
jgi:hypothetical protein